MRQGKDTYLGGSDPTFQAFGLQSTVGSLPPTGAVDRAACLCPVAAERQERRKKPVPIVTRKVGAQ